MTVTVKTEYTYPITDTATGAVNTGSLKDELDDAGLSVTVGNVNLAGSNIIIELLGDAVAADITIVDAVIAAHQGTDYSELPVYDYNDETAVSDDTGNEILLKTVNTGPLYAGKHMVHWSAEIAATTDADSPEAKVWCSLQREGQTEYSKGEFSNRTRRWQHVSVPFVFHAAEGQSFDMRIYYQRMGTAGNAARIRRARISIHRAE